MRAFLKNIIIKTVLKKKKKSKKNFSNYELAKAYKIFKIIIKRNIKDSFLISIGILSASFGFKGFLLTNKFIDGGATGISLLISAISNFPLYLLIIIINTPFIILAYRQLGSLFTIKTILAITGLALCLAFVSFPNITDDKLLVSIFGGFFLGAGIGFAIRGGSVIDGTEVLAIYLNRKLGISIGDIIIIINVLIFSSAAYLLGIEIAMYSMITYLAASRTLNFIVDGLDEYIGVTIVSTYSEEIKEMIVSKIHSGVTIYEGKKGVGKSGERNNVDIIYSVITRLEINKLNTEIEKIDSDAFVVMNSVKDTIGGMTKRKSYKHK